MGNETEKIIAEQLKIIPKELRDAISSVDYAEKLQTIVRNNKLMIDQAGKLEQETTLVLLGLEPLDDYINNLKKNIGLSDEQTTTVAHDINELIFKNVRESLRKISEGMKEADKEAGQTPQTNVKEETLEAIEKPESITNQSPVNRLEPDYTAPKASDKVVEIRPNTIPEIAPESDLPLTIKQPPLHTHEAPVDNIIESKSTETVAVPKQTVIIEEKTKLPEIKKDVGDPYREPIN
jgi:hypothetical protein